MSRFDIELAVTVATVVEEGAFDAAARRLRLTPSAVSQRVRLMEEQLGRVLIVRSRPVRATEAGEAVVRFARQTSLLEQDAADALGLGREDRESRVRVPLAVDADSMATWVLPALTRAAIDHAFDLELHRADQSETIRMLESGRVIASITSETTPVAGCVSSWLGALRYEAVASASFLAQWCAGGITRAGLARAPFVCFDRDDGLQADWLTGRGVEHVSAPRHFVPSSQDLLRVVEMGLGWAMVPTLQAAPLTASGTLVPLGGEPVMVPLYWHQWNLRSRLLDGLRAEVIGAAGLALTQPPLLAEK